MAVKSLLLENNPLRKGVKKSKICLIHIYQNVNTKSIDRASLIWLDPTQVIRNPGSPAGTASRTVCEQAFLDWVTKDVSGENEE